MDNISSKERIRKDESKMIFIFKARHGKAWRGQARLGKARQGLARQGGFLVPTKTRLNYIK